MIHTVHNHDSSSIRIRSLVVTFPKPAGRLASTKALCDEYGSVVDLNVNGIRQFVEESPIVVQPDLLVDKNHNRVIGLSFELTAPAWMLPRCDQMLKNLDLRAIRISDRECENYVGLEVLWAQASAYERQLGQLDFGLWGFLYSTAQPSQLDDDGDWTPPDGLVIGDVNQLRLNVDVSTGDYADAVAEIYMPE